MAFVRIGRRDEVQDGAVKVYEVEDQEIAVCNVDGELFAIYNVCTHDEGSLGQGELIGFEVECPRHGARFDVRNGKVKGGPALLPIDTFAVRVEGDGIEVDL